jgi:uroporphyrinogen decarboxylase
MKSRERVLMTLNHKEPDKVPIDLGGTICSTLTSTANRKLKEFLGIKKDGEIVSHPVLDTVVPVDEILDMFEVDIRPIRLKGPTPEGEEVKEVKGFSGSSSDFANKPSGYEFADEYGTRWRKAGYDYAPVTFPLAGLEVEDLKTFKWPNPYNPGRVQGLKQEAKELYESSEFAIASDIMCGGPFEQSLWLRGYQNFMEDLYLNQKFAAALLDKITEIDIGFWDAQLSSIGEYVDIVCQGDDLGMQTSLYIDPDMYRKFIKPFHKRLFSFIHSKTKAKVWLHSCGSVYAIIPDLIDVGIEVLNPVQCGACNMGLEKLKTEFGKDIAFWGGGINVQDLPGKTVEEVKDEVKNAISTMAPGGGFVFASTHNILPETEGKITYNAYMSAVKNRDYSSLK